MIKLLENNKTGDGYLLALAHPLEISIDPRVCLIKNMLWVNGINVNLASGNDPAKSGFTADKGRPVITFNHNLKNPEGVINQIIRVIAPTSRIGNKNALAKFLKDYIQGPPNSRYSQQQIDENVKELSSLYIVRFNNSNFKVGTPTQSEIDGFDLTVESNSSNKTIKESFIANPTTFEQFLNDSQAANLDDDVVKDILTSSGVEVAKSDPIQEEQEKLDDQKKDLDKLIEEGKEGIEFTKTLPLPYYVNDDYNSELGIIGNIFINIKMLYEMSIDSNLEAQDKKEKNDIALYDFIKSIMSKVQVAIGNVNNFDIFVENNLAKIIDINYVDPRNPKDVYDEAFQLEMHNLKSTVRSYKLESKIFQEQSSIVAVGAQVGGGALGTDTTSLVAFNRSVLDRIIPIKDAPTDTSISSEGKAKAEALLGNLKTLYKFFGQLDSGLFTDSDFDVDKASGYSNALKDLITYMKSVTSSKTNNRAILPTVLSVDMDGIGGLIIGTIFKTPLDILPKGYKGVGNGGIGSNLGYIITGLGHSVGNGDWVTKIEAQTIILDPPLSEAGKFDYTDITIDINPTSGADTSVVKETKDIVRKKPNLQGGKNDTDIVRKYGEIGDTSQLVTMTFPYPMYYDGNIVKTAKCHRLVKDDLEAIFKEILTTFGLEKIKKLKLDQYSGLYNVRNKRGGSTPSIHSWAIAIDLYAAENSLKARTGTALFSKPEYKSFIDIWYKHNFKSFGRELGYDWMHFQVKDAHF